MNRKILLRLFALVACLLCARGAWAAKAYEAYAYYTYFDNKLTFCYDDKRSTYESIGKVYDLNTGYSKPAWNTDSTCRSVTKVVFDGSFNNYRPTSTYMWFADMNKLYSITGISYLKTKEVTNMVYMFDGCGRLSSLDLSCFNTANVTNMQYMFRNCSGLTSLDLSDFNTANVTSMGYMFQNCSALTTLDLSTFSTAAVTNMNLMFNGCTNLETIHVGDGWNTSAVTSSTNMFYGCTSLVGDQGTFYDPLYVNKARAHIDGGSSNPGYLSQALPHPYVCFTPSDSTMTFYYDGHRYSRTGTTYSLNAGDYYYAGLNIYYNTDWYQDGMCSLVNRVVFDPSFADARPTTTANWFSGMTKLKSIVGMKEYLNTTLVTDMSYMFRNCKKLTGLDLTGFKTFSVKDMSYMFYDCQALRTIAVSNIPMNGWSTYSVTSSEGMFYNCTNLVGEKGTTYSSSHTDEAYAHVDGGTSNPGYLSSPSALLKPYACYTPDNTTLTFYYDDQRYSRTGTTYDLNAISADPGWYTDSTCRSVTKVVFNPSFADARPATTNTWFRGMTNLTTITGMTEYLNTSEVQEMNKMFLDCSGLTSLDLSNFNTANVYNMNHMFYGCTNLESLDLSSFNTAKVTDMGYMFLNCVKLTSLDLRSFNTANVNSMNFMFFSCSALTSLDLSSFNTANVTNMSSMFNQSGNLTTIYVGNGWTTAAVTSSSNMFYACSKIVGGMGTRYTSGHTDKTYAHIDGGTSNPGYLTDISAAPDTKAYACYTPSNTTLTFYYDDLRSTRTGTTYDLNTISSLPAWYSDSTCRSVTKVVFNSSFASARPSSTRHWFAQMNRLTSITGISYLRTSQVTSMFGMFQNCSALTSLDVSNFNTANVANMGFMFINCSGLTSLDVSDFNTANVTNMGSMFSGCSGLTSLDVSSFNTANVTSLANMFDGCSSLTSLDLSSFNTSKATSMAWMFRGCSNLTTIYVGNEWSNESVTGSTSAGMFSGCTSLVGGMGTTYSSSHTNHTYARIDGGTANPGYFSEKKEAYVCYTPSNTTLTFYYDAQRSNRTGVTGDLNEGDNNPVWYIGDSDSPVTTVVFDPSFADARPTTTCSWFRGMINLTTITGINYLNTSDVTNMYYMFAFCRDLTSLDVSGFNTAKVTNMEGMFGACRRLTSLDLSNFNTANVTNMSYMFAEDTCLTSLNVSSFSTAKVTNMQGMFGLTALTSLDLSNFNTANVMTMETMFYGCSSLTSLNLGNFNTANVINMPGMFAYTGLTSLDLSSFNTANVENMNSMFFGSSNLTTIFVGNSWKTNAVTNSDVMFWDCTSLVGGMGTTFDANHIDKAYAHIDGGTANPGYFTAQGAQPWSDPEAYACYTPSDSTLTFYYDNQRGNRTGTTYDLNTGTNEPGWYSDGTNANVTKVDFNSSFANASPTTTFDWFCEMGNLTTITGMEYLNTSEVTNMHTMFRGCSKLTSLDLSNFNTANVINMHGMFFRCSGLTSLNVTNFNTANVTNMGYMFYYCSSLTSLDVSHFNTAKVTNMGYMFDYCSGLTSLDLSSFNTAKVTSMEYMFYNCSGLTSLDLSSFNTANVTAMSYMFYKCSSLTSLDLGNFNTAKAINMSYMFFQCSSLTSLDLGNFNTAKVINMQYMFQNCSGLTTVYVGEEWTTAAVAESTNMFRNCTSLVGGQGTTYDADHIDKAYARIDGGTSNPGYFTAQGAQPWTEPDPEPYACYTPSNTTLTFYYDTQRSNRTGTTYDLNTGTGNPGWRADQTNAAVTQVTFDPSFADARPTTGYMWFYGMSNLESITGMGQYLNTTDVTNMKYMFCNCSSLTSLDLSGFNTANVTTMEMMFYNCSGLTSLDVSGFNTGNVTFMSGMFIGCSSLTSIDVTGFNTANVTGMAQLFKDCSGLTSLDLSSFNTANVTNMGQMFQGCSSLTSLDLSSYNTANVTVMLAMFQDCSNLVTIYVGSGWTTTAVEHSENMFTGCTSIRGGQGTAYDASHVDVAYAHIDGGTSNPGYFTAQGAQPWTEPNPEPYACYTPSNTTLTFYYDTERGNRTGTTYDLNEGMNDPGWDTDNSYKSVTHVVFDASFADARPTSMSSWFWGMTNLQSIDGMDCVNTEDVTTMWGMFTSCSSLTVLDVSSFNTAKVVNALSMFDGCSNLTTIYGGDGWITNSMSVSSNMFKNCVKLVGGKGTTYDANHTNKAYARIDGGPSSPGYFTDKLAALRGDVNGDGMVNLTDVTLLIGAVVNDNYSSIIEANADMNGDGALNLTDVTMLINMAMSRHVIFGRLER